MTRILRLATLLLLVVALILPLASVAFAQDVYVHGYYRRDGTYVQPHYRTRPDSSPYNNYSTYPNVNPYTGQQGTRRYDANPYATPRYDYSSPWVSPYQRR